MEKILSIVIPTYNAETFLDKGLPTFIMKDEKKMQQLEVLIVNDGTPDNSVQVAQKYVDQYPDTFKIINKENGGHGSAINVGVDHVIGKYFKCVDADDWVDTAALERLLPILEKEDFEAMIQSYRTYDISKDLYEARDITCDGTNRQYNLEEIMQMWDAVDIGMSFHGVLYNTQFYKSQNYRLVEGVFYEDQEYATIPLCRATKIRLLDDELYVYRIGDVNQSVSAQSQLSRLSHFEAVTFRMLDFEEHLDELPAGGRDYWAKKVSKFLGSIYQIVLVKNPDKKSHRKYAKEFTEKIKAKSPYMYERIKNKYKAFVILNRLHMDDDTYNASFTKFLQFMRRVFRVNKLYA